MGKIYYKMENGRGDRRVELVSDAPDKAFKELFTIRLHNIKYYEVYEIKDGIAGHFLYKSIYALVCYHMDIEGKYFLISNKAAIDRTPEERDDVEALLDTMENIFDSIWALVF